MTDPEITKPNTNWSIDNADCPNCGSNNLTQLIINERDRFIDAGGIHEDEWVTEYDLLETRCTECETLLQRSDGFISLLKEQD